MQVYEQLCHQDGIALLGPCPHSVKDFSLSLMPGTYRRLLVCPKDLSWQLLWYSDPQAALAVTALDRATAGPEGVVQPACSPVQGSGGEPLLHHFLTDLCGSRSDSRHHSLRMPFRLHDVSPFAEIVTRNESIMLVHNSRWSGFYKNMISLTL